VPHTEQNGLSELLICGLPAITVDEVLNGYNFCLSNSESDIYDAKSAYHSMLTLRDSDKAPRMVVQVRGRSSSSFSAKR